MQKKKILFVHLVILFQQRDTYCVPNFVIKVDFLTLNTFELS